MIPEEGLAGGVIVAGYVSFAAGEVDRLRASMDTVIAATRAEPGCILYTYARLLEDPDTIRIFEIWESGSALTAHFQTPHMADWYAILSEAQVRERHVKVHPFTGTDPLSAYRS
ncbi:MAG: putative quinol monooxygenase [Pseudomonadota bacterium]